MDVETVKHVATLARLKLTDEEVEKFTTDLKSITSYVAQLGRADVEGVPGTVHPVGDRNSWREDEARPGFTREEAVANAPEQEHSYFKVPPVIE